MAIFVNHVRSGDLGTTKHLPNMLTPNTDTENLYKMLVTFNVLIDVVENFIVVSKTHLLTVKLLWFQSIVHSKLWENLLVNKTAQVCPSNDNVM